MLLLGRRQQANEPIIRLLWSDQLLAKLRKPARLWQGLASLLRLFSP